MEKLRISKAPIQANDSGRPIDRVLAQPLILGLFLPTQNGGWSATTTPRGTSWSFDYNARLTVMAEELGFDLVFALAQWMPKGGFGGESNFREITLDALTVSAGLAPLTHNILLISTIHVLYGWHPVQLAKLGATLDHMSGGRWGINVVTGYKRGEVQMFGYDDLAHDLRYEMATEFTDMMLRLWRTDGNVTCKGQYWQAENAFIAPKPVYDRPIMVNAGSSKPGIEFAVKYSDLLFITSTTGADPHKALDSLPSHTQAIRDTAAAHGRELKTIINPHVICRETEKEAQAAYRHIQAGEDAGAVDNLMDVFQSGSQVSFKGTQRSERSVGGNLHLVGSPEQIVDWFIKLQKAGCDGMQVNFFDFIPDLEFFGERVLPLMKQAGLRL